MPNVDFGAPETDAGFLPSEVLSLEEPRIPKELPCCPLEDMFARFTPGRLEIRGS